MAIKYVVKFTSKRLPDSIGNKALNLRQLTKIGMRIPTTIVVTWEAYQRYIQDDTRLVDELRQELVDCLKPDKHYAVRSSANIEDSLDRSFAGQFKSVLNVQGVDEIFQAIWSVWGTAKSDRVISYLEKHDIRAQDLAMAVIIQEMIDPVYGGVSLSRNPVTGADEIVVEAVEGSGDAIVQSGVTPMRWINKWESWILKPESNEIPFQLIEQIVVETRQIAQKLKSHVDLEWVSDGKQLYWLQVREITTLNQHNVYSNHISKEMVPGMTKPLIGSVNIPLVCGMWARLLKEMVGEINVRPEDLAKAFYYRVYFNMGTIGKIFEEIGLPADSVETLTGVIPDDAEKPAMKPTLKTMWRLPRILVFMWEKWNFAKSMEKAIPQIEQNFRSFDYQNSSNLSESELLSEVDRLFEVVQNAAYYNIVGPLLMMMYNRVIKGQLARKEIDFSEFDLMANVPELKDFDPTVHLHNLYRQFSNLDETTQDAIRHSSFAEFLGIPNIELFQQQVSSFIDQFGYLSDSGNDFSEIPWRETPDMVLDLIVNFTPGTEDGQNKIQLSDLKLKGLGKLRFGLFYRRAREFHLFRERIGAAYNYGYGLFRYYYLALGSHLVQRKLIKQPEDIFYLEDSEVRQLVHQDKPLFDVNQVVTKQKEDMERFRNISLPTVIYGDDTPPIEDTSLEKLVGIPTSIGHYSGQVTVVRGIRDFNKVQDGDVLVIPYSDVGWTPLFARAGAVVAESGGMLSHSSIIAREYNLPAVVSVEGATRLADKITVTVNGHTGEIFIHEQNEPQEQ